MADEKEVTREVLESDRNLAWDEAENRLSAMMALLAYYGRPHFRVPDPEDIEYYDVKSKELLSPHFRPPHQLAKQREVFFEELSGDRTKEVQFISV